MRRKKGKSVVSWRAGICTEKLLACLPCFDEALLEAGTGEDDGNELLDVGLERRDCLCFLVDSCIDASAKVSKNKATCTHC